MVKQLSSEFKSAPSLEQPSKYKEIELSTEDEKWLSENIRFNSFSFNDILYSQLAQLEILSQVKNKNPIEIMHGSGWRGSDLKSAKKRFNKQRREISVVHVPGFQEKNSLCNIVRRLLEKINAIPQDLKKRVADTANLIKELRENGIKEAGAVVIHLGDIVNSEYSKDPPEFFLFLQNKIARPYNIKIALENIMKGTAEKNCQNQGLDIEEFRWTYDPRELIKLLQRYGIDLNLVGLCLDTAHFGESFKEEIFKKKISLAQLLTDIQELINKDNIDLKDPVRLDSVFHNMHLVNIEKKEGKNKNDALPLADKRGLFSLEELGEFLSILQADKYSNRFTLEVAPEPMNRQEGKIGLLTAGAGSYLKQSIGFKQNDPYIMAGVNYLNKCEDQVRQAMLAYKQMV